MPEEAMFQRRYLLGGNSFTCMGLLQAPYIALNERYLSDKSYRSTGTLPPLHQVLKVLREQSPHWRRRARLGGDRADAAGGLLCGPHGASGVR